MLTNLSIADVEGEMTTYVAVSPAVRAPGDLA